MTNEIEARVGVERLLERVKAATGPHNALDIEIDLALFVPDQEHVAVRPNNAKTKLVYTRHNGKTDTFWARDHTLTEARRKKAVDELSALISQKATP